MEWSDQNRASHHICGMSSQPSYHIIFYHVISLLLIIRFRSISISWVNIRFVFPNDACYETMSHTSVHGSLSIYYLYIYILCHILYIVYCILYPQEATYQLPKDQMWPTWLFPLLPQSVWPTWKIFHKWQSKVFWLKGLVHMWSLAYNLVMSYLLLALCVLKSRYFIQY